MRPRKLYVTTENRMAEFAAWGVALAEALGIGEKSFLKSYDTNITLQSREILQTSSLLQAIILLLEDLPEHSKWEGTVGETYSKLLGLVYPEVKKPPQADRSFPGAPNKLRNALNRLQSTLFDLGVEFTAADLGTDKGGSVTIAFQKLGKASDPSDIVNDDKGLGRSDVMSDPVADQGLSDEAFDDRKDSKNNGKGDQSD